MDICDWPRYGFVLFFPLPVIFVFICPPVCFCQTPYQIFVVINLPIVCYCLPLCTTTKEHVLYCTLLGNKQWQKNVVRIIIIIIIGEDTPIKMHYKVCWISVSQQIRNHRDFIETVVGCQTDKLRSKKGIFIIFRRHIWEESTSTDIHSHWKDGNKLGLG